MQKHAFLLVTIIMLVFQNLVMASPNPSPLHYSNYVDNNLKYALQYARSKKIPVSICLAQAMHESAAGQSTLALQANNHFGIKAIDTTKWTGERYFIEDDDYDKNGVLKKSPFRKYTSVEASFRDYADFLSKNKRYQHLFYIPVDDYRAWANGLVAAGYATDPEYATYLIEKIEKYELYKYDLPIEASKLPNNEKIALATKEKKIVKQKETAEVSSYNLLANYDPEKPQPKKTIAETTNKPVISSKKNQEKLLVKKKEPVGPSIASPSTPKIVKTSKFGTQLTAPACPDPVQKLEPMASKPIFLSIKLRDNTEQ
jgi:hypothetical protein